MEGRSAYTPPRKGPNKNAEPPVWRCGEQDHWGNNTNNGRKKRGCNGNVHIHRLSQEIGRQEDGSYSRTLIKKGKTAMDKAERGP